MHWLLTMKAESKELYDAERELIRAKGRSAIRRAMHLLAIEKNIVRNSKEHNYVHSVAEQKAFAVIRKEVEKEKQRAIKASKANNDSNKDNNMYEKEKKEGSEKVDSSGGEESSSDSLDSSCTGRS